MTGSRSSSRRALLGAGAVLIPVAAVAVPVVQRAAERSAFLALCAAWHEAKDTHEQFYADNVRTFEDEQRVAGEIDRLDNVALRLEREIAGAPARTCAEMHAKAKVAERMGERASEDIAHSLVADILREGPGA
ncbi:hypothetical protein [Roseomonas sp. BN140053]|uniref:hypothetical protein n=1 Tax=Roseomonas sp. BN140053 TaxID=3391898 RepID=UPI0039ECBD2E